MIETARLKDFRQRITDYSNEKLAPEHLMPRLAIDAPLPLTGINGALLEGLGALEPFGAGNPRPVFHADGVEIIDGPHTLKAQHLRMTLRQGRSRFRAVAWRAAERESFIRQRRAAVDLAFSLTENNYRGESHIELTVADVK